MIVLQGHHSVGLMWWMLAREVLRMRGTISREHPWEVMPDLYFYRDPEEVRHMQHTMGDVPVCGVFLYSVIHVCILNTD